MNPSASKTAMPSSAQPAAPSAADVSRQQFVQDWASGATPAVRSEFILHRNAVGLAALVLVLSLAGMALAGNAWLRLACGIAFGGALGVLLCPRLRIWYRLQGAPARPAAAPAASRQQRAGASARSQQPAKAR